MGVDAPAGEGETPVNATSATTITTTILAEDAIEEKEKEKEMTISSKSAAESGEDNIAASVENEAEKQSAEKNSITEGSKIISLNSKEGKKDMTFAEKMKARAQRFGIETEDTMLQKKLARAKRFGIVTKEVEEEKKRNRAKRFGLEDAKNKKFKKGSEMLQKQGISSDEVEKRLARAKRFGTTSKTTEEIKAALRKQRFATSN